MAVHWCNIITATLPVVLHAAFSENPALITTRIQFKTHRSKSEPPWRKSKRHENSCRTFEKSDVTWHEKFLCLSKVLPIFCCLYFLRKELRDAVKCPDHQSPTVVRRCDSFRGLVQQKKIRVSRGTNGDDPGFVYRNTKLALFLFFVCIITNWNVPRNPEHALTPKHHTQIFLFHHTGLTTGQNQDGSGRLWAVNETHCDETHECRSQNCVRAGTPGEINCRSRSRSTIRQSQSDPSDLFRI